ncbi:hypothetical protein CLV59_109270 [Chitinophaga dinghuensis]|uniref:Transmembrane protein n=1 Tax=Chitinophaga dinghuensis TaxID=1539050 RepID=A0A327VPF9_9BACT|nr:hypothetical protein [Chitinophaga dinghuensis]RAJ75656.1 hypothetical protein CLV59_109270 [Chitinophaga dinghuensis]
MPGYYELTIEDDRLLLIKNRQRVIVLTILFSLVSISAVSYFSLAEYMAGVTHLQDNYVSLIIFISLMLGVAVYTIIRTVNDKDIEIIREGKSIFYVNGEFIQLNQENDFLEVQKQTSSKGIPYFTIYLHTETRRIEICKRMRKNDYETNSPLMSEFLGLPIRMGKPWIARQVRKWMGLSE